MAYNVGDIRTITGNSTKHKFKLGTKVEIILIPDSSSYLCGESKNGLLTMKSTWYFVEHEDLSSLTDILKQL